jgi:hypothetical protein
VNWKIVAGGVLGLLKLGQVVIERRVDMREGLLHGYDRTAPHPSEGKVPANRGGSAFATRYEWVCECGARGRGSASRYDAERLARGHVLKKPIRESHNWHLEQQYPPREGWFQPDGSEW